MTLSNQVYKWVQANCWGKLNKLRASDLRWTSIPSRRSRNTCTSATSCYRNCHKLRQLRASLGSKASHACNVHDMYSNTMYVSAYFEEFGNNCLYCTMYFLQPVLPHGYKFEKIPQQHQIKKILRKSKKCAVTYDCIFNLPSHN